MSFNLRDGHLDVAIVAGPGLSHFPTRGVTRLTQALAENGLRVGVYGGDDVRCKGVLPRPDAGAVVLLEDAQQRIHRIQVSALVRVAAPGEVPLPFAGSWDPRVLLYSSARRLQAEGVLRLGRKRVVLLGGGNRTLSFGSSLLAQEASVVAVSPQGFDAAWQVERIRFERRGGLLAVARPQSFRDLEGRAELTCSDAIGLRVFQTDYVVSVEEDLAARALWREYPKESLLFEFENRALLTQEADVQGWRDEENIADVLAGRILKVLRSQRAPRRARDPHQESGRPATVFHYRGKWLESESLKTLKSFSGTPRAAHTRRMVASIECLDSIPCNACEAACPEKAIRLGARGTPESVLKEDLCTACGICVEVCPSEVPVLIEEKSSTGKMVVLGDLDRIPASGGLVSLVNRRGEGMGTGRSLGPYAANDGDRPSRLVTLEVPQHLLFEVRGFRVPQAVAEVEPMPSSPGPKIEIQVDGHRRQVEAGLTVLATLRAIGRGHALDNLYCADGSCRRCLVTIDGVKQLGCQTRVRAGISLEVGGDRKREVNPGKDSCEACPCLGTTLEEMTRTLKDPSMRSMAVHGASLRLGEGKCRGRLCVPVFKRLAQEAGHREAEHWIDWRFPSEEWVLNPGSDRG